MGFGYTPVLRAQESIANTIQGGLSRIGQNKADEARMSLEEAGLMHQIGRQEKADVRADRGLEMQEERLDMAQEMQEHTIGMQNKSEERQAQAAMMAQWEFEQRKPEMIASRKQAEMLGQNIDQMVDKRTRPLTGRGMASFFLGRGNASRETVNDFIVNKLPQLMKATGATAETTKGGETNFRKQNGQLATWLDMPSISPIASDVFVSGVDPVLKGRQMIREYEKVEAQGAGTPEQHEKYLALKEVVDNPAWQLREYQKLQDIDIQKVAAYRERGMDTSTFETNIARRNGKMKSIQSVEAEKAKHENKIELEEIKAAGKTSTLEKETEYLYKLNEDTPGVTRRGIAKFVIDRDVLAEKIRGFNEEYKNMKKDDDRYYDDENNFLKDVWDADVKTLRKNWGLDIDSLKSGSLGKPKTDDPDGIRELLFK